MISCTALVSDKFEGKKDKGNEDNKTIKAKRCMRVDIHVHGSVVLQQLVMINASAPTAQRLSEQTI